MLPLLSSFSMRPRLLLLLFFLFLSLSPSVFECLRARVSISTAIDGQGCIEISVWELRAEVRERERQKCPWKRLDVEKKGLQEKRARDFSFLFLFSSVSLVASPSSFHLQSSQTAWRCMCSLSAASRLSGLSDSLGPARERPRALKEVRAVTGIREDAQMTHMSHSLRAAVFSFFVGLVFPRQVLTKHHLVVNGVLPLDHMR